MKKISIVILSVAILVVGVFGFSTVVKANPLAFLVKKSGSGLASTTPTYLVQGTAIATTTFPFDTGENEFGANTGTLLAQMTASSTLSGVEFRYEYSNGLPGVNCVTNELACDWYSDNLMTRISTSTTPGVTSNVAVPFKQSWVFSSSSDVCSTDATLSTNNRGCKAFEVKTPTRYFRVVAYSTTATRAALYFEWIIGKENN